MKLILTADVPGLGAPGDIVEVKDGYGRNFLLPRGLAIVATKGAEKQVATIKRAREAREIRDLDHAKEVAGALGKLHRHGARPRRAGDGGRLFGSITAADVVDAVRAAGGPTLDRRTIELPSQIKTVGTHPVTVRLHPEVTTEVDDRGRRRLSRSSPRDGAGRGLRSGARPCSCAVGTRVTLGARSLRAGTGHRRALPRRRPRLRTRRVETASARRHADTPTTAPACRIPNVVHTRPARLSCEDRCTSGSCPHTVHRLVGQAAGRRPGPSPALSTGCCTGRLGHRSRGALASPREGVAPVARAASSRADTGGLAQAYRTHVRYTVRLGVTLRMARDGRSCAGRPRPVRAAGDGRARAPSWRRSTGSPRRTSPPSSRCSAACC